MENTKRKNLLELIKYGFWGGVTTLLNLALFSLFISVGIPYLVSNVSSYIIAVFFSYFLNKKYVFKKEKHNDGTIVEILKYFAVRLLSIVIDSGLLWVCVDVFQWNIFISKLLISAVVILMTYCLNKLFVFNKKEKSFE